MICYYVGCDDVIHSNLSNIYGSQLTGNVIYFSENKVGLLNVAYYDRTKQNEAIKQKACESKAFYQFCRQRHDVEYEIADSSSYKKLFRTKAKCEAMAEEENAKRKAIAEKEWAQWFNQNHEDNLLAFSQYITERDYPNQQLARDGGFIVLQHVKSIRGACVDLYTGRSSFLTEGDFDDHIQDALCGLVLTRPSNSEDLMDFIYHLLITFSDQKDHHNALRSDDADNWMKGVRAKGIVVDSLESYWNSEMRKLAFREKTAAGQKVSTTIERVVSLIDHELSNRS